MYSRYVFQKPIKKNLLGNFFVFFCSRKLGLDLVPRQGAHMVEPDSMSVVELYHVHLASAENTQGVSVSRTNLINNFIQLLCM